MKDNKYRVTSFRDEIFIDEENIEGVIYRLNTKYEMMNELYEDSEEEIKRLNNIINIILDFNLFKDECPLCLGYLEKCDEEKAQDVFYEEEYCENCSDDYKKCWLKYFKGLQELKGDGSNENK